MEHPLFPNESAEYRTARNALLDAEIALRRQVEAVAAQRRSLPPGGEVPEDYVFERIGANERPELVRLSELFGDHPSILLYSFMYGPERESLAPDALTLSTAGTAASSMPTSASRPTSSPSRRSRAWRRWRASAAGATSSCCRPRATTTPTIILATRRSLGRRCEPSAAMSPAKSDEPMYNVFRKDADGAIRHFWVTKCACAGRVSACRDDGCSAIWVDHVRFFFFMRV